MCAVDLRDRCLLLLSIRNVLSVDAALFVQLSGDDGYCYNGILNCIYCLFTNEAAISPILLVPLRQLRGRTTSIT